MPKTRRRVRAGMVAIIAAAGLVAGIAASSMLGGADSDEATLRGFQIRVLNVSQAAAENRLDGALDALEALEKDLDLAAGEGLISAARYRGIEAALEAVRADITGHITAQAAAVAETEAVSAAVASPAETAVAEQQVVQVQPVPAAPAPAAAPEPAAGPAAEGQSPELPEAAKEAKGKGKGAGKP